jgi:hypothetical protein
VVGIKHLPVDPSYAHRLWEAGTDVVDEDSGRSMPNQTYVVKCWARADPRKSAWSRQHLQANQRIRP